MDEYIERESPRYIDASKLPNDKFWDGMTDKEKAKVLSWFLSAPTADVVEARYGNWTIKRDEYDCEYMVCSCCGECFYDGDNDTVDNLHNYCPNCGANMRQSTFTVKDYPRCHKCVHEIVCPRSADDEGKCKAYKRDPKDGGFYG